MNGTPLSVGASTRKNLSLFTMESCVGTAAWNMTTGAFMAGYAAYLGASDSLNGLIACIPMMTSVIQLFSPLILERLQHRKTLIVTFMTVYKLLVCGVIFIPLFISGQSARLGLLIALVMSAHLALQLVWPGFTCWLTNSVPKRIKGKYFGVRDSFGQAAGMVIPLTMGIILDQFKPKGALLPSYEGFLVVFSVTILLTLLNIWLFTRIDDKPVPYCDEGISIGEIIRKPLQSKSFRLVIVFFILWNIGFNTAMPFLAVFQVKHLGLNYKVIMALDILAKMVLILTARSWGKLADKFSWAHTAAAAIFIYAVSFILTGFITPGSWTIYIILPCCSLLSGLAWGGLNISLFNLPFVFIPEEKKTVYLGLNAALSGIFSLIAVVLAGRVLEYLEKNPSAVSWLPNGGYQGVFWGGAIILLAAAAYAWFILRKMSVKPGRKRTFTERIVEKKIQGEVL